MLIIKPDSLPPLWWLFPWSYARQLYRNANALKALCDRQDDLLRGIETKRPRWSIWISGVAGPDRKYLFVDNDAQGRKHPKGISFGTTVHFHGDAWTVMKDPEDAIIFCDRLNKGEVK